MVIGAPRSGTAWCANWLTDNGVTCHHDPMWDVGYWDFDTRFDGAGIACTGIGMLPNWVNEHRCPKVILHRPRHEVQASLEKLGLPRCPERLFDSLWRIKAVHVIWTGLFNRKAQAIHAHLNIGTMNYARWEMLKDMTVTANYWARKERQNLEVRDRLAAEGLFA